jgi:hypothetical protein
MVRHGQALSRRVRARALVTPQSGNGKPLTSVSACRQAGPDPPARFRRILRIRYGGSLRFATASWTAGQGDVEVAIHLTRDPAFDPSWYLCASLFGCLSQPWAWLPCRARWRRQPFGIKKPADRTQARGRHRYGAMASHRGPAL